MTDSIHPATLPERPVCEPSKLVVRTRAPIRRTRMIVALGVSLLQVTATAATGESPAPAPRSQPGQLVEWTLPAQPPTAPLSEEEKQRGRREGRALPQPELLQPQLDASLPLYEARSDLAFSGTYRAACSDVLPDLVKRWLARFSEYYPKVSITVSPPYAGSLGAQELIKENLDFVFVSRELKPEDISAFRARFGYDPLSVPISGGSYRHYGFLDAMAFIVHKDNPLEKLTYAQLDAVFSSTRHHGGPAVQTWEQLGLTGPRWQGKPVHAYAIKPWNGFEEFIRQRVLSVDGRRGEWRGDLHFDSLVFPVAARVAADPLAIGYTGLAYVDAGVRVISIAPDEKSPAIAPSYEYVASGEYPLGRLIFFNANSPPDRPMDPVIDELLRFILSREGQQIVLDHQIFLPLRGKQVSASRALLTRARAGF